MKSILIFIIFIICAIPINAQITRHKSPNKSVAGLKTSARKPVLQIDIFQVKCHTTKDTCFYLKLYKNSSLVYNLDFSYNLHATINNIEPGSYRYEYTNLYNRIVSGTIRIDNNEKYSLILDLDDFDETKDQYEKFIDNLPNNSKYSITFESYGCYHWSTQKLEIQKKNNQVTAILYPEKKERQNRREGNKIIRHLSDFDIVSLRGLEKYMFTHAQISSSTESTTYTVAVNNYEWVFLHNEESRQAFYDLRNWIFYRKS